MINTTKKIKHSPMPSVVDIYRPGERFLHRHDGDKKLHARQNIKTGEKKKYKND